MIRKSTLFSILLLLSLTFITSGYKKPDVYTIDASKNATMHNNLGLQALSEHNYYCAIQEFNIAIMLNPKSQATAVYYNNLGETYMELGYYKYAQGCFEKSINQYSLNFAYYQNLVKSFKAQKLLDSKIKYYQAKTDKNDINMIILGLMYVENGNVERGIIKLDEFCMKEPDLLITGAVRNYINALVPTIQ